MRSRCVPTTNTAEFGARAWKWHYIAKSRCWDTGGSRRIWIHCMDLLTNVFGSFFHDYYQRSRCNKSLSRFLWPSLDYCQFASSFSVIWDWAPAKQHQGPFVNRLVLLLLNPSNLTLDAKHHGSNLTPKPCTKTDQTLQMHKRICSIAPLQTPKERNHHSTL